MKRLAAIALAASAAWAGIGAGDAGAQTAEAPGEQPLAPAYPGSVRYPREELGFNLVYTAAFLSKDDLAAVKAFYERELGPFRNGGLQDVEYAASEGRDGYLFSRALLSQSEVHEYVDFGESGRPEAGVVISAVAPQPVDDPSDYPVVGAIFEKLQDILNAQSGLEPSGYEVAKGHGPAELEELIERYKDLAWRYYLPSDQEASEWGDRPTTAGAIVARCKKENKPDKQALQARIQELAMQGRAEEAQRLAVSMIEGGGDLGSWDVWLECLQEIEKHAYRTWIAIDEHPSVWKARIAAWEAAEEQQ